MLVLALAAPVLAAWAILSPARSRVLTWAALGCAAAGVALMVSAAASWS